MLYHISRDGQNYGPYTLEDLHRYVSSGNVLLTDMTRAENATEWVPVSQVLSAVGGPAGMAQVAPVGYSGGSAPGGTPPVGIYPDPPNLHWALVLLIGMFTCGLFLLVWAFVQAVWMRKVNQRSNAVFYYIAYVVIGFGGGLLRFGLMAASGFQNHWWGLGGSMWLVTFIVIELGHFDLRRSMEEHFNGPEPMGLILSPVITFFFAPLYFQYHMSRINELKRIARYRGAAI